MQRNPFRAILLAAVAALVSVASLSGQAPPKDPWTVLDGTYYPPGTEQIPLPEPAIGHVDEDGELVLRGEWSALAETYRQSLERLGEEDRESLLAVVADLEVAAVAGQPERRIPKLANVELSIVRKLAKQDPESVVPVFQLHHDLYLEHKKARQWYLLHHSVAMVKELAELYVGEARTQGARINAARILASLAGHLQAGQQPTSVALFEDVLKLDPSNASAYLGLAAHYEKRGGPYEAVVKHLKDLLEVHPDHREGRLRLAINQLRLGKSDAGRQGLAELLAEPASDWIYRLAAQELAHFEAAEGRIGKAISVLEKAIQSAPGDQKLCILLAFLYDRNRQSFDSHRIAKIASQGLPAAEAPRGRYNSWPQQALEEDREQLRQAAANRVQLLARILNAGGETNGSPLPEVNP